MPAGLLEFISPGPTVAAIIGDADKWTKWVRHDYLLALTTLAEPPMKRRASGPIFPLLCFNEGPPINPQFGEVLYNAKPLLAANTTDNLCVAVVCGCKPEFRADI